MIRSAAPNPVPLAVPQHPGARLMLFAMRQMAAGGLNDAIAAYALMTGFGIGFRRPLVLLRAFVAEAARVSTARLAVAPHCCMRMTTAEGALLAAVADAGVDPNGTHDALCRLLHVRNCLGLVTSAQAVEAAFSDLGLPLRKSTFTHDDCVSRNHDEPL